MKSSKYLNYSILFLGISIVLGCKKEKSFLDKLEVGKYEITQFKEYPDGSKDTLKWIGYGPWQEADRYFFDLDTFSTVEYNTWYLQSNYISLRAHQTNPIIYESSLTSLSETELVYTYNYYVNSVNQVSDSANGTLIFKRIAL